MSLSMLVELWDGIKSYIPVKERQEVADIIVEKFDDHGLLDGAIDHHEVDRTLKDALCEFVDIEEEDIDD